MSRHRTAVIALSEQLRRLASDTLSQAFLENIRRHGINKIAFDPRDAGGSVILQAYVDEFRRRAPGIYVADIRAVEVSLEAVFNVREAVCVVADSSPRHQQMIVAETTVKARITTRWVDLWSESAKRFEWPSES